jgi:hypothetical protein
MPSRLEEVVFEEVGLDEVWARANSVVVEDEVRVLLFVRREPMEILARLLDEEVGGILRDQNRLGAVVDRFIGCTIFSLPSVGVLERKEA